MKPLTRKEAIINGDDITPVNRQEYWLKQMGGGSGGGGALVVGLSTVGGTAQLDKTWQEIYNAVINGPGVLIRGGQGEVVTIMYPYKVANIGGTYRVDAVEYTGAVWNSKNFKADSADGKPVLDDK